ncbi:DUF4232 domain-containing protein [Streptomyces seoulensis]|uniref:DUF4232 domain-containing protein n=1 Tax=Streptomyces seoulensis TaxID=73044 RepID=A0A4P6U1H7_STRSO|nr:DUF4232 domain-containing protein [Streptomyces seoulensis]QBJ93680.1 DUF4232 domain-containing protein [Streptomyces seoulensis]
MANSSPARRRGTLLVGSAAVLGLLTACGNGDVGAAPAKTVSGSAAPATETSSPAESTGSPDPAGTPSPVTQSGGTTKPSSAPDTATRTVKPDSAKSTRCHTSELRAAVGRNDPGAGQENFPVVLTNKSSRTCTLRGYPGAAFVNASGTQLGPDPQRTSGSPVTVTLRPGQSAWAGLTFSNPQISGAKTGKPASLVITPPDERDPLKVTWTGGTVPVSGNSSSVRLTVFAPGSGA